MTLKNVPFSKDLVNKSGLFLCVCAFVIFASASPLRAGAPPSASPVTPCDPQYMDALEARAWLEAQREITQNKNLIYKPDSVLEYTCFDRFLDEAASNFSTNRQFSETDRWGGSPPSGFSNTSTNEALENVVLDPVIAYLNANFNTAGFNAGAYLNNRTSIEYTPGTNVSGANYTCNQMRLVWQVARCANFIPPAEANFDSFFDFARYETATNDPRREANAWGLMCMADGRFASQRAAAFNNREDLFDVTTEIVPHGDGNAYDEDAIVTHLTHILPGSCGSALQIPTGIRVQRPDINGGTAYDEVICSNPGCSFDPAGPNCVP